MNRVNINVVPLDRKKNESKESRKANKAAENSKPKEEPKFPHTYPEIRYKEWKNLSEYTREILQTTLRYREKTWNKFGMNTVEERAFEDLTEKEQEGAMLINIDENIWDCFIHHYISYGRKDLVRNGLDQHVAVVKSNRLKSWEELTDEQKQSAAQCCYFKETWDYDTLGTW